MASEEMSQGTERRVGAYGVCREDGRLLVIRKALGSYKGKYDLAGGGIEFRESPEETVVQEFIEETGLRVAVHELLGAYCRVVTFISEQRDALVELHHLGFLYRVAPALSGAPVKSDADGLDSLGATWVPLNALNADTASPLVLRALDCLRG